MMLENDKGLATILPQIEGDKKDILDEIKSLCTAQDQNIKQLESKIQKQMIHFNKRLAAQENAAEPKVMKAQDIN